MHYSPKNYPESQIVAGSSGGVSGMIKEYCLLDNGQLFLSKGIDGEWLEIRKLKKKQTKDIFEKANQLGLSTVKFDQPGNMTYYLIFRQPPRSNTIKWGKSGVSAPEGLSEFYHQLLSQF